MKFDTITMNITTATNDKEVKTSVILANMAREGWKVLRKKGGYIYTCNKQGKEYVFSLSQDETWNILWGVDVEGSPKEREYGFSLHETVEFVRRHSI